MAIFSTNLVFQNFIREALVKTKQNACMARHRTNLPIVTLAEPSSSDLIPTNVENAPRSRDLAEQASSIGQRYM
jgi:hypothetical protein